MIIITDIHGNFNSLMALLDKIPQEEKDKGIVCCGDLIDRGPRSMQVVQWIVDNNIPTVVGNHEQMMVDWNQGGRDYFAGALWLGNGGNETLKSYEEVVDHPYLRGDVQWDLFQQHCDFMNNLPIHLEFPNIKNSEGRYLVISHSNINNVWGLRNSNILRDRKNFINQTTWGRPNQIKDIPEIYNVVGHTPQENGPRIRKIYACIDTGCFYKKAGYGKLTALQFPEMVVYSQENID